MAKETVGDLYLSLGIDLSKLESDYLKADETVSQNMKRLQDQIRNTKLQIKVDSTDVNLSEAERLLKLQEDINRAIDLQREKVELATNAWRAEVEATNEESAAAQKLQGNMMREQINLNKMMGEQRRYASGTTVIREESGVKRAATGLEDKLNSLRNNAALIDMAMGTQMAAYLSALTSKIDVLNRINEKVNASMRAEVKEPIVDDAVKREYERIAANIAAAGLDQTKSNIMARVMPPMAGQGAKQREQEVAQYYDDLKRYELEMAAVEAMIAANQASVPHQLGVIARGIPRMTADWVIGGEGIEGVKKQIESMISSMSSAMSSAFSKLSFSPDIKFTGLKEKIAAQMSILSNELRQSTAFSIIPDIKLSGLKEKLMSQLAIMGRELKSSQIFNVIPDIKIGNKIDMSGVKEKLSSQMSILSNELKQSQIFSIVPSIKMPDLSALNEIKSKFAEVGQSLGSGALKTGSEAASKALEFLSATLGRVFRMAAVATVFAAIGEAIVKMAHPAIEAGESIYRLQQHMHATSAEAVAFNNIFKVAGGSSEQAITSLMRLDKTIRTAGQGGNEATRALAAFGVSLKDSNGALLPYNQQLAALAEGYQKAKQAGLEEEYVTATLGVRGREMVSVLEDYVELQEKASQIKGTGMINPEVAHELEHESNLLSAEWGQLGNAFSAALQPAASEILPKLIDLLKSSVALIADHKDAIFAVSMVLGKLIGIAIDFLSGCIKLLNGVFNLIGLIGDGIFRLTASLEGFDSPAVDAFYQKLKAIVEMTSNAKGFNPIDMDAQKNALAMMNNNGNPNDGNHYMTDSQGNHYNLGPDPNKADNSSEAESRKAETEAIRQQREEQRRQTEEYDNWVQSHNRAVHMIDQANQIMFHNQHQYMHTANDDYQDAIYDIRLWEWETQQSAKTAEETASIHELAAAKMAAAWQSAVEKIKQLNESIQDKIFHLMHNETENQLYDLQNETNKYLQQGADPGLVDQYYGLKQKDIVSKANNGQGPQGYHDVIVHDGHVTGESYGTGRDRIDIRPMSTAMQQIDDRMPQLTEIVARIPQQNQQILSKMDTVYSRGTATATVGKRDVVDYNLNVNVTGLQDLNHQVAESAAKQILDRMPKNTNVNYGYAV